MGHFPEFPHAGYIPVERGEAPKKKRTPFYWVSKLKRAIRKWLQPLDFGYISKKRTPLFGIKNEEHHENVAKIP